jgi:hypothetical protein
MAVEEPASDITIAGWFGQSGAMAGTCFDMVRRATPGGNIGHFGHFGGAQ